MKRASKELNFELNLVPFLDLLSVCIYFLLLTAIWVQIGGMNVKQAIGPSQGAEKKQASVWMSVDANRAISLTIKESQKVPKNLTQLKLPAVEGKVDLSGLEKYLEAVRGLDPAMEMAIIQPQAKVIYDDLIQIMDRFRGHGFSDLGMSPL